MTRYQTVITDLPVDGLHIDVVRAPEQLLPWVNALPAYWVLSAGVIDGRNIWRNDLDKTLALLAVPAERLKERLWIAPSCSLLHTPVTLAHETQLDDELKSWLAFADEKLDELNVLTQAINYGVKSVEAAFIQARLAIASRKASKRVNNEAVQARMAAVSEINEARASDFSLRQAKQKVRLQLPLLPTTTIGSFPQTADIRAARAAFKKGELPQTQYHAKNVRPH